MDRTTETIVDFVDALGRDQLSANMIYQAKKLLVDSVGCALGAMDSEPARIARSLAGEVSATSAATVIGLPQPSSPEIATFANTVMVRYLDYNDMYFSPRGGGGHPSDLMSTALAVGEAVGASGPDVLLAITLGYEVLGSLIGAIRLRERGWDQGLYTVVASAMITGKMLGLSRDQLAHAVSLAITPNVPTRRSRAGALSMWKGCATAAAARNGVFAARLASRGMTGPPEPFEGDDGIFKQVTGPFELDLKKRPEQFVIEQIHTKFRPIEFNAQGPVDLILRLRDEVDIDAIEQVEVGTYWLTYSEIGSEPEKWSPQTRETADHSLPYLLAAALVDGEVGLSSFGAERIMDPKLRALMQCISVAELNEFTNRFPTDLMCRIAIRLRGGGTVEGEIAHPHGHIRDAMSDDEIDRKFDALVESRGGAARDVELCQVVRQALWALDTLASISTAMEPLGEIHAR